MAEYATYRGRGGGLHRFPLPLSPAFAEQVAKGYLVLVDEAPSLAPKTLPFGTQIHVTDRHVVPNPAVETLVPIGRGVIDTARPAHADAKAKWVAYAVAVSDLSEDEAKAMTKAELVERFGH